MEREKTTHDSVPQALDDLLLKLDKVESMIKDLASHAVHRASDHCAEDQHVLIRLDEASKLTHLAAGTLRAYIRMAMLPGMKVGRKYLVYKDELMDWLDTMRDGNPTLTMEKYNDDILKSHRRKPKPFRR
ncbi:MAG: helix-turn-helix domain-containing protein [Prevotella sp.]